MWHSLPARLQFYRIQKKTKGKPKSEKQNHESWFFFRRCVLPLSSKWFKSMDHGIYHFIYICLVNKKYCIFTRKHNKFYIVTLTNKLSNWYKEINKIRTHMNGKLLLKKNVAFEGEKRPKPMWKNQSNRSARTEHTRAATEPTEKKSISNAQTHEFSLWKLLFILIWPPTHRHTRTTTHAWTSRKMPEKCDHRNETTSRWPATRTILPLAHLKLEGKKITKLFRIWIKYRNYSNWNRT